jgi:hypothetical protein
MNQFIRRTTKVYSQPTGYVADGDFDAETCSREAVEGEAAMRAVLARRCDVF